MKRSLKNYIFQTHLPLNQLNCCGATKYAKSRCMLYLLGLQITASFCQKPTKQRKVEHLMSFLDKFQLTDYQNCRSALVSLKILNISCEKKPIMILTEKRILHLTPKSALDLWKQEVKGQIQRLSGAGLLSTSYWSFETNSNFLTLSYLQFLYSHILTLHCERPSISSSNSTNLYPAAWTVSFHLELWMEWSKLGCYRFATGN